MSKWTDGEIGKKAFLLARAERVLEPEDLVLDLGAVLNLCDEMVNHYEDEISRLRSELDAAGDRIVDLEDEVRFYRRRSQTREQT